MRCFQIFILSCLAILVSGCGFVEDDNFDFVGTELGRTKVDDLSRAIEFAANERQFDQREFLANVQTSLNRWVSNSQVLIDRMPWRLDPLFEPLMQDADGAAAMNEVSSLNFIDTDAFYLQEMAWLSNVIQRLPNTRINSLELYRLSADDFKTTGDTADQFGQLFAKLNPQLDARGAQELAKAHLLFDWIMRNVQLLPEVDHSNSDLDDFRLNDRNTDAAAGIPGTGYQRFPHQSLLYGRGDYIDRAKLFMIGLRIIGLDSIVLATPAESGSMKANPWAVAVSIGGEYFLFDTRMALPIPGSTPGSTATLTEIRRNPTLLEKLNLTIEESLEESTKYWVKAEQLDSLEGLIYTTPESVSKRFALIQENLADSQFLPYVNVPSTLVERLPTTEGIELKVWDIAVKTHQFRQALREALEDKTNNVLRDKLVWYHQEEGYIVEFPRYRTSRVRFFYGMFENQREFLKFNAIDSFQNLLYTDQDIDGLKTDSELQQRLGILTSDQDSVEFKNRLTSIQGHMRLVRRDAGVFLAQCHFDNNSYGAAENWVRILRARKDVDRWEETINYLAARAAESQKDYDSAVREYRKQTKSTQAHGNIIRARLLEEVVKRVYEG